MKRLSIALFIALAALSAEGYHVIQKIHIGAGTGGAGFDPGTGLAFSSNGGDGTLTLVREVKGKYEAVETVPTGRGSRTMTVDLKLHRVYLPAAEFETAPAQPEPGRRGGRTPAVPDSFHLLVVGR